MGNNMKFINFHLSLIERISSYWEGFKMVIFHYKALILAYKENQVNKRLTIL
jgi:hypothetical protein